MRIHVFLVALLGTVTAACSQYQAPAAQAAAGSSVPRSVPAGAQAVAAHASRIAALPDRGDLFAYDRRSAPLRKGASTFYPISISEAHALHSMSTGGMVVAGPDGRPIRLRYVSNIAHPGGNWTWVGRVEGGKAGAEAILTFGPKAVFGTIPSAGSSPLQLTTSAGRTWLVDTNSWLADGPNAESTAPKDADFVSAGGSAANPMVQAAKPTLQTTSRPPRAMAMAAAAMTAQAAVAASNASANVDVVLGYTVGFANRLGGQSQAVTRLQYLVDLGNQAYVDSQVAGRIRMVRAIQVNYPDNTSNQTALFELSGLNCTASNATTPRTPDSGQDCVRAAVPPTLLPLVAAKVKYGADLVSMVRNFVNPENGSCGTGWLIGAGQTPITVRDSKYGYSVVSDSDGSSFPSNGQTCRQEYLVHELGHNMGLQHDRGSAAGGDGILDPSEYGRFPYSFGYDTGTTSGDFYTIMSLRRTGQTGYRVFSNPRITTCGGFSCGVIDQADNARALSQTMPIVAAFGTPVNGIWINADFDGDTRDDLLWRNAQDGRNTIWRSANSAYSIPVATASNFDWIIAGVGDFNGDGKADILWRNSVDGRNSIWLSGKSTTPQAVTSINNLDWTVAGIADFDADGKADIFWRNNRDGRNTIWKSANAATAQAVTTASNFQWTIAGMGDFNGDGKADVLWRNSVDGRNSIWLSANSATPQTVLTLNNMDWTVAGIADFDGDGKSDIFWRNMSDGRNTIWKSANSSTAQAVVTVKAFDWVIGAIGDFNGDGKADLSWYNSRDGRNSIWLSANSTTTQSVTTMNNLAWFIAG